MRQRRGLSPRTVQAVSALTPQDVDDLLTTMPFLAPILPVPAAAPSGAHPLTRTPRRSSNKLKTPTPRGSMMLSARNSDPGGSVTPTTSNKRQGAMSVPLDVYRLTLREVELATRAWVQILATNGVAAPSDADGGAAAKGSNAPPTQAALFSRACTEVAHLRSGRQLRDILQLIHIPVLPLIADLLEHVVELAGSANQSSNSSGEASLHFFRFLQFLSECRHLDAVRRHRQRLSSPKYRHNDTSLGVDASSASIGKDNGDEAMAMSADEGGLLDASTTEALQMEDIRATYAYLKDECAHSVDAIGSDGGPVSPRGTQTATITAETLAGFAQSFELSLLAVLPKEYLVIPPTPRAQSTSLGDAARGRSMLETPDLSQSLRRANSSTESTANLTSFGGLPPTAKTPASPTPAVRPPPTLLPSMAGTEVTLDHFAEHVCSRCNDVAPLQLQFHHDDGDTSLATFGMDVGDASVRNGAAVPDASVHSGIHRSASKATLLPLKLGAVSPSPLPDADPARPQATATVVHPSAQGGAGAEWLSHGYLTCTTLRPYATWLESHSPLSTMQLPPRSYTSLTEGRERHKQEERARRERESRLRDEYLYGPARPKPKKTSAEEESVALLNEATDFVDSLDDNDVFAMDKVTHHIHSMQCGRLMQERKEANRYAFMLGGSTGDRMATSANAAPVVMKSQVRHATAQEILSMLQRCPQDSVLGTQTKAKATQRLLGMNGLEPKRVQGRRRD